MSIHMTVQHSRRAILAGAIAGLAAALSIPLGRLPSVAAADSEPIALGQENVSTNATTLTRVGSGPSLIANGDGPGVGCAGTSASGIGLYGVAQSGHGVVGTSENGSGVEAISTNGVALRVRRGRVRADGVSGVASIRTGETSVTIQPAATVVPDAFVLLTPMSNLDGRDLWVAVQPARGTIDIRISQPADAEMRIGWFLMG